MPVKPYCKPGHIGEKERKYGMKRDAGKI